MNYQKIQEMEDNLIIELNSNLPKWIKLDFQRKNRTIKSNYMLEIDGEINLRINSQQNHNFYCEIKTNIRFASLVWWSKRLQILENNGMSPFILLCNYLSPPLQNYCLEKGINFIDHSGNIFIKHKELLLVITGKPNLIKKSAPKRITLTLMKLLFILLSDPNTITYTYRELAEISGISLGAVNNAFEYLQDSRFCRIRANGQRHLLQLEQLTRLWIHEYSKILKPKIKTMRFSGALKWQSLSLDEDEYWIGEAHASTLTNGYFIAEMVQLITRNNLLTRGLSLKLKPDLYGKIELMTPFWGVNFHLTNKALELLTVGELISSRDDRNIEIVENFYEQYI